MATASMALGLVVAPMGWVLMLAATVTPRWREFSGRPDFPQDVFFSDGLWESCMEMVSVPGRQCHALLQETAMAWPLQVLRALTIISLLTGVLSYPLAHAGVRWWTNHPTPGLTGTAGLLLVLSGTMYICATSYMAYRVLENMASAQTPARDKFQLGTCLYLGWSGGVAEILAGICLAINFQKEDSSPGPPAIPYELAVERGCFKHRFDGVGWWEEDTQTSTAFPGPCLSWALFSHLGNNFPS
uniref:Claudin n=1 Tax=Pelusios castaneus TaxID=367368 RepID=A0A8C8R4W5_9SAUR